MLKYEVASGKAKDATKLPTNHESTGYIRKSKGNSNGM